MKTLDIEGAFVIQTPEIEFVKDVNGRITGDVYHTDEIIYFQQDMGKDKAKYFTEDISKAKIFFKFQDAYEQCLKLHTPQDLSIKQVKI